MKQKFGIGLMAVAATGFVGGAHAASLDDLIPQEAGTEVILSDENRQTLIDREGEGSEVGIVDVGDSIRGIITFDQLKFTRPGEEASSQTALIHAAGNSELTGEFQVQVASKTALEGGLFAFTFEADPEFDTEGNGTLIRLYEDDPSGTTYQDSLDDMSMADNLTDGDFYFGAGLGEEGNSFISTGLDDITVATNPSSRLADTIFALSITEEGSFNRELVVLMNEAGFGEFIGVSTVGGPVSGSDWPLSGDATAEFQIVPTPSAVLGGLMMLGLFAARRRTA